MSEKDDLKSNQTRGEALIQPQIATEHTLRMKREMDIFYKTHCINSNDPLTIILKTHLYLEESLNQIFLLILPKPQRILEKRFSEKVDIFEALSLSEPPDQKNIVVRKMRIINKLRNSFVHKLDKQLTLDDFRELLDGITVSEGSDIAKLKHGLVSLIGYFNFLRTFNEFFPFASACARYDKIFKRDKGYSMSWVVYPWKKLIKNLSYFEMR